MYRTGKNRKIHLPKLLRWQKGTMMSGHCLAQLNTQCDHGTWTIPVLGRTRGSTPGIWDEHQSCCCCCPRTPLQRGVCPRKQEKEFIHSSAIHGCPNQSFPQLLQSRTQAAAENPSKQWFARLGDRFFSYWLLFLRTHIPHNRIPS